MKQPDQREAEAAAADPWMTPERISLRNLAMSFTQKEIVPHLQDWEDAGELPRELHRRAAAAGLLGIRSPPLNAAATPPAAAAETVAQFAPPANQCPGLKHRPAQSASASPPRPCIPA